MVDEGEYDARPLGDWLVAGALAGAGIAMADFGASWLWLTTWQDRGALLIRTFALLTPIGALAGLLPWTATKLVRELRRRFPALESRFVRPSPYVVLASPLLARVAYLLFTGGKASRIPLRPLFIVVAFGVLCVAMHVGVEMLRRSLERARTPGRTRTAVSGALFAGFYATAKANQHVLPQLYEYLHVLLSTVGFAFAITLGLAFVDATRQRPSVTAWTSRPLHLAIASLALLATNVVTLDLHPNVRVALHEPRTPHARSLMHIVSPTLHQLAAHGLAFGGPRRVATNRSERAATRWNGAPLVGLGGAHVLLVTVDALRADHLGTYGYARPLSPHIDELAAESIVFERAYTAAPHSSYSLASLMTSEYLHEMVELDVPLPEATLAATLAANGYYTAGFFTLGIFHTEGERLIPYRNSAFAFDRHQHDNPRAEQRTDQVLAEYDRIVARGEPPSLVWAHYFDTHEPYLDTSLGRGDLDRYDGEIRNVDRAVGRLVTEARARLERPVIVVLTADHGEEFHEHGGVYHGSSLYDEQVRVPLIVHAEGIPPRRVREPVETIDIAPTVLGLAAVERASTMRGQDLRPYMMGLANRAEPAHSAVIHKRMVVDWPFKLIADLRFDLYELYDLDADPGERRNLAGAQPERVRALREDVYEWLDRIRASASRARDQWEAALDLGRLRDRRAVEPLSDLVRADNAPTAPRIEAARLLGRFADVRSKPALVEAMNGHDAMVAAEAAISLGRMFDDAATEMLRSLVRSEDPGIRARAGISLARLGERDAVPSLLETLRTSRDQFEREEAVRWLGRLGDPAAMDELTELIGDFRIRHLTVVSLGQLHDARALPTLLDALTWEHHATIRNSVIRGLGELGDARAVPTLVSLAWDEPELDFTGESLVRARALDRSLVGGLDFDRRAGRRLRALSACTDEAEDFQWLYVGKTSCELLGRSVAFSLRAPAALRHEERVLVLFRARARESGGATVELRVGTANVGPVTLDTTSRELRFDIPASALRSGTTPAEITVVGESAGVILDHLLLVPRHEG